MKKIYLPFACALTQTLAVGTVCSKQSQTRSFSRNHIVRVSLLVCWILAWPLGAAGGDPEAGKELFQINCQICHGENGNGQGNAVADILPEPRDFSKAEFKFDTDADWERGTATDIANVIRHGAAVYGGSALMVPWSNLSENDVNNLVAYIDSLKKAED